MTTLAQIEALKQEVARLSSQHEETARLARDARKALWRARIRTLYYRFAKVLRSPAKEYSLWIPGVQIVGTFSALAFGLVFFSLLGLSTGSILLGMTLAGAAALGALSTAAVSWPATAELPSLIAEQQVLIKRYKQELTQLNEEAKKLRQQNYSANSAINEILKSDKLKRELLLKQNWKAMRDDQWEMFLEEVFNALGAHVIRTGKSGDQGVDLVMVFGNVKIAVQAKGYLNAVNNSAVQEAVAGRTHWKCNRAAVITNSRFTRSAKELAASNACFLIGEQEFPAFVLGSNLDMFQ